MPTIQAELENLKQASAKAQKESVENGDILRTQLEAIRSRVKNGESTGDRLYDFTLIHYSDDLTGYVRKIFADLEAKLAGKTGQLFLIAEYSRGYRNPFHRHDHHGGYPMPTPHRPPDILTLGFLSDDKLLLDQQAGTWRIPSHEGPVFFKEDDRGMHYMIAKWGKPLDEQPPEIVAGDEDILAFFKKEIHRFAADEVPVRRDIVLRTLGIKAPEDHWVGPERDKLRDDALAEALESERRITDWRFKIESELDLDPKTVVALVKEIQKSIFSMNKQIELAVQLGIDPQRSEIVRMRENFGHYWKTEA